MPGLSLYPNPNRNLNFAASKVNIPSITDGGFDIGSLLEGSAPYLLGGGALAALLGSPKKRKGQVLQGAVSGATTGASIGSIIPGVGTGIGAGVGALAGGLLSANEKSPEEIRDEKFKAAIDKVSAQKNKALTDGTTAIGKQTSGLAARFKDSAARRASAMGRTADVEAFQAPVAGQVANVGNKTLSDFITTTNKQYDDVLNQLEMMRLNQDIDPNSADYLTAIAPVATKYAGDQQTMELLKKYLNLN